ncbi:UDP-N-acetylmuramyl-tripeptide synthetase [Patescibacteria group bacterium]|nr:UDP-N-acetylmuramyl-tripeptide synthetase [Patescibacteria group bacterium]
MRLLLDAIKKILPNRLLNKIRPVWHGFLAYISAVAYGFPSGRMVVIGVTGTAGKSTTVQMLSAILNASGSRAGYFTTVGYFDGITEKMNTRGLSMPSGAVLQRNLSDMFRNKCSYAVIEATSEGLAQNRHLGIDFDVALFTNLSPAHIEAHGGFKKYKAAKAKLFSALRNSRRKKFFQKKILGVNLDDEHAPFFSSLADGRKFGITFDSRNFGGEIYKGTDLQERDGDLQFNLNQTEFKVHMAGKFNAYNALMASACANMLGVDLGSCAKALLEFRGPAGRMEKIEGRGFDVYVDYAPEPLPMLSALDAVSRMPHKRLVHVFGSTGGHRDVGKRFEFGGISARYADKIILTNDDVYDSDPDKIIEDIKTGISKQKNRRVSEVQTIPDREQAIKSSISTAQEGDIILITGKGSEQFLVLPGNKRIVWDDRDIVKKYL